MRSEDLKYTAASRIQLYIDAMIVAHTSIFSLRRRSLRVNACIGLSVALILVYFISNQAFVSGSKVHVSDNDYVSDIHASIDRVRNVAIRVEPTFSINVSYQFSVNYPPEWIEQYRLGQFFNFHWLQNGAYRWHLQRLLVMHVHVDEPAMHFAGQVFQEHFDRQQTFDYLQHHPERGVIIDSASDPVQSLFAPLPRAGVPLENLCAEFRWFREWYPCHTRSERILSEPRGPLITYALYNVTIGSSIHSPPSETRHSNELIHLVHSEQHAATRLGFVRQFLSRLVRLLALVPPSTVTILVPYLDTNVYVGQYLDVLVERGLVTSKQQFISYNSSLRYHADAVYSTSSPRSDLALLHRILVGGKALARRELILIIDEQLHETAFADIVQIIGMFQFPDAFDYLRIYQYKNESNHIKQIGDLFQQARIVVGMSTDLLSSIVWCQPDTHIIEFIQESMTTDYYEMSLQLNLHYWLASVTRTGQIDTVDFRNVMLNVLTDMDR